MRVSPRRFLVAVLTATAVLASAACGDDDSSQPPAETSTTTTSAPDPSNTTTTRLTAPPVQPGEGSDAEGRISDSFIAARFVAQQVTKAGEEARDVATITERVAQQYPEVEVVDGATAATATQISVVETVQDTKQEPSEDNRVILAFAVADTSDRCVAGAFYGFPVVKELVSFINADIPACSSDEATTYGKRRMPKPK